MRENEYRAILADERGTKLTMAAEPDGALHIPFQRNVNLVLWYAASLELVKSESHHRLGPAHVRNRRPRIKRDITQEARDHSDVPLP